MNTVKIAISLFLISILLLAIASYTQVDLNLTLLNWQPYLDVQKQFTQLGYFNRPLNAFIFTTLFITLSLSYFCLLYQSYQGRLSLKTIKKIILTTALILFFSYSVFSHDIFNYLFDARIITKYSLNPYQYKALDFPMDEWTRFMHWTHRTYPYGPTWLFITIVPSFIGLQKLLPTLVLFKIIFICAYLAVVYLTHRLLKAEQKNNVRTTTAVAAVALHPLILIDGILSPHLDIVMAALVLASLFYLKREKKVFAWGFLLLSIGVKFATALFVPAYLLRNKVSIKIFYYALFILAILSALLQTYLRGYQPWYGILPIAILPFVMAFMRLRYSAVILLIFTLPLWIYLNFIMTGVMIGLFR